MEGILNLLRKLGYSENEIKNVLNKVPVEEQGLTGTNVATGIFSKPKEGKLAKDFLVSDVIGNPFEIDYYKGRSREDILKSAEAQLNMINDELLKISYQIVNKNLKLTDDQLRNFSKNLEAKRRFEKDFEAFKTKPEAEVLDIETGKKVGDIETLKEKSGLVAPPTSPIGKIDLMNKQMLQKVDDLFPSEATLQKEEAKRQALIAKQYEGKGYAGGTFGPSGMYRSVARDFLLDQNAKGIIKLDSGVVKSLEDRAYVSGGQPLMYPDPIRVMRFHYGDDVFEKIPLDKIKTGAKSEILDAMSKVEASPVKTVSPATPGGYMTPGEIKANIDELKEIENMVKRRESRFADMTEEQIQNELEQYGSKRSSFEMAFQSDHPKEYEQYLKLNNPKEYYKAQEMKKITPLNEPSKPYKPFGSDFTRQEKVDWLIKNVDQEAKVTIPSPEFLQNMLDSGREDLIDHFWEIHTKNIGSKPVIDIDTSNLKNPALVKAMMEDRAKKPKLVYSKEDSVDDAGKVNKDDPEKFAKGGSVESKGLDYLTGMEPSKGYANGGRINFEKGSIPKMLKFLIDKLADEKDFNRKLLERSSPKAVQDLYIEKYGKLPSAEEIKDIVNKQLQNKGSMEVMNPKTGEVTTPKNPIMTVEDLQFKHKDAFKAHDQIFNVDINDKIAPDMIAESMAEMKGKDYFSLSQKEQSNLYKKALAYVDDVRMIKKQNKPIEGGFSFNDPDIKAQMDEAMKEAKKRGDEMRAMGLDPAKSKDYDQYIETKTKSGDKDFNKYFDDLEIKTKFKGRISDDLLNQILIDDNPQRKAEVIATIEQGLTMQEKGMSPEEIVNILKNTTRTKQAQGGRIGYAEGSEGAPSITLDTHDKAPDNMDKYPVKVGNLELGISGLMTGGKSYQANPYNKITGSERNISVRGKYNVPDTGISIVGDVGDMRMRNTQNINAPQYNYKETIRDVMRAKPYSVGIEYAPNQNRNINLRYDDQGNVTLRGEYKFAKGGLGYLMGE
jgi:hypothetical protein